MKTLQIGFLGFGNMAGAMADGFLRSGALPPERICACAKNFERLKERMEPKGMIPCETAGEVVSRSNVIVAAVKPYLMEEVLSPLKGALKGKAVLTVAAGWGFAPMEQLLGPKVRHLSLMPNTPVSVCEGVILAEETHTLTQEEHQAVMGLLSHLGTVVTLPSSQMDAAGTISGCGPAWAAMFLEALGDAGVYYGLPRQLSYRLAAQMLAGAGKLQLETGTHPGLLKDGVCSPGGTTIAGVAELERRGFRAAVIGAVDAVQRRRDSLK